MMERARAEAEAIKLKGDADAAVLEAKAKAEASRAQQLSAHGPLGAQLALLSVYSEMVSKSNEGVQKIVYSDLQSNNLGILGLPSLDSLGANLTSLEKLGQTGVDSSSKS